MKTINTYRHIAGKILRFVGKPVTKQALFKLSHFLDKLEKDCHTGPDRVNGRYDCTDLYVKFVTEKGSEGIRTKFFAHY